jgi:hypothetical protein
MAELALVGKDQVTQAIRPVTTGLLHAASERLARPALGKSRLPPQDETWKEIHPASPP